MEVALDVPQVARALQTAPVVPLGAFPNGSSGTQFTAVPGAWAPGDQAEANHATEEAQAERQKTREREAAEELQACREQEGAEQKATNYSHPKKGPIQNSGKSSIPGIDGDLDAVQTSGGSITLQIHDLEGDVVGTVEDSESVTKLASTYNSTEFGVPQPGTTSPKYAWLGASGVSTETSLGSGVATQSGASYIPQVARALQTAPVIPPGAFPDGSPGTQFTATPGAWTPGDQAEANHATEEAEAERQKAKEEEAAAALQICLEQGGCGDEESGAESEIGVADPEDSGKWGHLHVTRTGEECFAPGEGCKGEFLFSGNITEKNGRNSTMVLRVVLEFDGERAQLYSYESHGEYTPDQKASYYIPDDAILYFYLDVWVGGIKDDIIKYSFVVVHGEVTI